MKNRGDGLFARGGERRWKSLAQAGAAVGGGVLLLGLAVFLLSGEEEPDPAAGQTDTEAALRRMKMENSTPRRLVLEGVPKVRYPRDGTNPFALCLKSCVDYLGEGYSYDYILCRSGSCFRMSWNHAGWGEGNMRLGHLGAEPFRKGFQAVGRVPRFYVNPPWWPEENGDDIETLDGDNAGALFTEKIVRSINEGLPVLAFGVVGPPEVSIVFGYDDGGEVLIGWSCFQEERPAERCEPDGAFRRRDWLADTPCIMVIASRETPPEIGIKDLAWAYRVCTLPKTGTHLFGLAAYKSWAGGVLDGAAFPADDEETLQSRRRTVRAGLTMMAERGVAASFLDDIAAHIPDEAESLNRAARLLREEGDCGGEITRALGGHSLPSGSLSDPVARRSAVDGILKARERHAEALKYMALALGEDAAAADPDGKILAGLRPARRQMTLLGCMKGCMQYVKRDVEDAWLYGVTGAAFMLNIDGDVDVSGPTSWDAGHLYEMMPYLGVTLENRVLGNLSEPDFEAKRREAGELIRQKIDAGLPLFGWFSGFPEFVTINGYDDAGAIYWSHYIDGGYRHVDWEQFGRNDTDSFITVSVEPVDATAADKAIIGKALAYAYDLGTGKLRTATGRGTDRGIGGYERWIRSLETGGWFSLRPPGVHHNVACWHECRCYAERFLRMAGEKIGGELQPLFSDAADQYGVARRCLGGLQSIFPYVYPPQPVPAEGIAQAVALLRKAKRAEEKGLAVIEEILSRLGGGGTAP